MIVKCLELTSSDKGKFASEAAGFGERLLTIRLQWQVIHRRRLTDAEIAREVANRTSREKPHTATSVGRWFQGTQPDNFAIAALADYFGVDPGWLAFGDDSDASLPHALQEIASVAENGPGVRSKKKPFLEKDRRQHKERRDTGTG